MPRKLIIGKALFIGLLFATVAANAAIIDLRADMDGAQANAGAGTGSTATGVGLMTFDDVTRQFDWNVSWNGLLGNVTVAHFHGPALPGVNASPVVTISTATNPSLGAAVLTAPQAADLLSGLWYINIHSDRNSGGEIRGQVNVVPIPAAVWLFGSGLIGLIGIARKKKA